MSLDYARLRSVTARQLAAALLAGGLAMQAEMTTHAIEEILHSFPWIDPHTLIDAAL